MPNPRFYIEAGETTPSLLVALMGDDGILVNLTGATVTFTLYELGGTVLDVAGCTIVNETLGYVQHDWNFPLDEGKYLGKFHVVFSNDEEQDFPSDRYMDVIVI